MNKLISVLIVSNDDEEVYVDATFVIPEGADPARFADRIHELLMDHFKEADPDEDGDDPTEKGFGSE